MRRKKTSSSHTNWVPFFYGVGMLFDMVLMELLDTVIVFKPDNLTDIKICCREINGNLFNFNTGLRTSLCSRAKSCEEIKCVFDDVR